MFCRDEQIDERQTDQGAPHQRERKSLGAADIDECGSIGKGILESYGVRFGIEEVFNDLKEIWGLGQTGVAFVGIERGGNGDEHVAF